MLISEHNLFKRRSSSFGAQIIRSKMTFRFDVLIVVIAYISVTNALPPCVCTREMKPVCGSDGQTYSNECMFNCKRTEDPDLTLEKQGSCEPEQPVCICNHEYAPVCGTNGVTYPNKCSLECERSDAEIAYKGECRSNRDSVNVAKLSPCTCTRRGRPVCGTDGNTYGNPCMMNCAREANENLHIEHTGRCKRNSVTDAPIKNKPPVCTCTRILEPVCGTDGFTYSNECVMKCYNDDLDVAKDGPCKWA